jgi:tRNA G37 N-methylase TrmD
VSTVVDCGRYEGVDERVVKYWSLAKSGRRGYVLSGGEARHCGLDATIGITRALGSGTSATTESFSIAADLPITPDGF